MIARFRAWLGSWVADDPDPQPSRLDLADGLTPGAYAWLTDRYPAGTADRVDALVRAMQETNR